MAIGSRYRVSGRRLGWQIVVAVAVACVVLLQAGLRDLWIFGVIAIGMVGAVHGWWRVHKLADRPSHDPADLDELAEAGLTEAVLKWAVVAASPWHTL